MSQAGQGWNHQPAQDAAGAAAPADLTVIVANAVEVLAIAAEETVGQSRKSASLIREDNYGVAALAADMIEMGGRAAGVWRDLAGTWMGAVGLLIGEAPRRDDASTLGPARDLGTSSSAASVAVRRVDVEVGGAEHAVGEAILDTRPDASRIREAPQIAPLHPVSGTGTPIAGARLGVVDETGALAVIVRVPDDQPPGRYSGVISAGDQLLGSIMIVVGPSADDEHAVPPPKE